MASGFKKETDPINFIYNMFSNIYFLSHVYSNMKLIHKISFSLQTCFPVQDHLAFR
jgi:hypothetical protein